LGQEGRPRSTARAVVAESGLTCVRTGNNRARNRKNQITAGARPDATAMPAAASFGREAAAGRGERRDLFLYQLC
jgi:hypothetical protein